MKPMNYKERRKREDARNKQLSDLEKIAGHVLLFCGSQEVEIRLANVRGKSGFGIDPEAISVTVGIHIADDHVLKHILQAVFDAGLAQGRRELQQSLRDLIMPGEDD